MELWQGGQHATRDQVTSEKKNQSQRTPSNEFDEYRKNGLSEERKKKKERKHQTQQRRNFIHFELENVNYEDD